MLRHSLSQALSQLIGEILGVACPSVVVEVPDAGYGDLASNVCFSLAKTCRKAPHLIAQQLADAWPHHHHDKGTLVATNGFLNLTLSDAWVWSEKDRLSGCVMSNRPQRVLLEYVSANPTGPLHIGHGRWAVLGSTLARILQTVGHQVETECYVNDAGVQIKKLHESVAAVRLHQPVPDDGYHGDYIEALALADEDPVQVILSQQTHVLSRMGTTFDHWMMESALHDGVAIPAALTALQQAGAVYEQDGAVWFASTRWGDDKDRVLIKGDGSLTYFAVDVAYHQLKLSKGYDQLINIWGADHHGYVPRVQAAIRALNPDVTCTLEVIIGQLVSVLKEGQPVRMSKRAGTMVGLETVLDEVGSDALRFMLLTKGADSPIEFDLSLMAQQSMDNPVFYVQYAHARLAAMLQRASVTDADSRMSGDVGVFSAQERRLLGWVLQWGDELKRAADTLQPHRVTTYAMELARLCHAAYETSPLLHATGVDRGRRAGLFWLAKTQLAAVLGIMGIGAPDRM